MNIFNGQSTVVSTVTLLTGYCLLRKIQNLGRKHHNLKNGLRMLILRTTYTIALAPREGR